MKWLLRDKSLIFSIWKKYINFIYFEILKQIRNKNQDKILIQ